MQRRAILPTIIGTPDEADGGGCYKLALHENPLEPRGLRVPGEPAREVCSAFEGRWVLLEHALRNLLLMPTPSLVAAIESGSRLRHVPCQEIEHLREQ